MFDEMANKLRKIGILIFSLLILLGVGGTAWGEGRGARHSKAELIILCMVEPGTKIPVSDLAFRPGEALSPQELQAITGKGMVGLRGTSQDPEAAARIILWDEASLQRNRGVTFSNEGNSLANAQSNALVTGGR